MLKHTLAYVPFLFQKKPSIRFKILVSTTSAIEITLSETSIGRKYGLETPRLLFTRRPTRITACSTGLWKGPREKMTCTLSAHLVGQRNGCMVCSLSKERMPSVRAARAKGRETRTSAILPPDERLERKADLRKERERERSEQRPG